jgi:tripartite-type tricarboxylate transporter receptor subunit TctC
MRAVVAALSGLLCSLAAAPVLSAQPYPNKPLRMIVPFVAGASYDAVARLFGQAMSDSFRQQVVVDNRPGASAIIGAEMIARSNPDGYTLGMLGTNHTILPAVRDKLPYDLMRDFMPVMRVAMLDHVIVSHPSLPAKTLKDLIALLKANPGKYHYGTGGIASSTHLGGELFRSMTGTNIVHVPYKGGGLSITGLVGNEVQLAFPNMISVQPHILAGRMRGYAVAGKRRAAALPDVPTTTEAGLPGYEWSQWYGIVTPAGLPKPVFAKLEAEIRRIAALPDIQAKLIAQGATPHSETPQEFIAFLKRDLEINRKIAASVGLSTQ